ncbi:Ras GTPase activating protein ira2, partial [Linderina pennispora]
MFWLAIGILQIGNIPLYKVGLDLLAKVLRALDNCGAFQPENGNGFEDFLMSARVPVEKAADQLDEVVGLSFRSSFPAALCLLLLKGMEDVQTKDECYDVVVQIINIVSNCRKWQLASPDQATRRLDLILPYLILILPTSNARNAVSHVFAVAGLVTTPELRQSLEYGGFGPILEQVHRIDIAHKSQTDYILYPSIIAAMLHKTRVEHDIMILYSILASSITWADQSKTIM